MPQRPLTSGRRLALVLLLGWSLPGAIGCHRRLTVDEHRVVAAVKAYNLALPRAYLARRAELVTPATSNEHERLEALITGLSVRGHVLDSRQESLQIGTVQVFNPPLLADVGTDEVWWYRHVDAASKAVAQAPRRIRYQLRYRLVMRQGEWLVDHIELLKSEDLPPAS